MYAERFLYGHIEDRPSCHAGTIVELPSGEYLSAFYAGSHEGDRDVAILTARLSDELDGWQDVQVVADTPGKSEGNPVLHVDSHRHVWLLYVTQQKPKRAGEPDPEQVLGWNSVLLYAMKSENEGRTWKRPRQLSYTLGWMTRNKAIRLSSGRTVLPCYDEINYRSFCLLSDDQCQTWEQSGWIEGPAWVIQPTLLKREDGSILALMRSCPPEDRPDQRVIWRSVSRDEGLTWSRCEPTELPNPNSGTDLVGLGSGHAVLLFNDTPEGRSPLTVALSTDDGETWPVKKNLETEPVEFSYPAVIQDRGGRIHVLYTWKRTHMKHVVFDENWIGE